MIDAGVEGPAPANGVADAVVERADAGALAHVDLRRLREALIVRDLAEVPALAVEVDGRAIDAVLAERQRLEAVLGAQDVLAAVVPHQVEAEAVHLVVAGPDLERVQHQPLHHRVLGRGVGAAARRLDEPVTVQPVVVVRHDAVEDGAGVLSGPGGVVVDDVHDRAQVRSGQPCDHLAEL